MKNYAFLLVLLLLIAGAYLSDITSLKPKKTPELAVSTYFFNQQAFDDISNYVCGIEDEALMELETIALYRYEVGGEQERIEKLDTLLRKVNTESVTRYETETGGCKVVVTYLLYGFAGDGKHISFKFNDKIEHPFDEEEYTQRHEIQDKHGVYQFQLPLTNGWILSYKSS